MGVAPRANLISVKVSDDDGETTVLDVIYGIQFAVDNKDRFGIRVVNLSLSSTVAESYLTDPLDAAAESAWFSGLVVVAAAGNDGTAPDAVSYAPGNDPYVISVGGMDDRGTREPGRRHARPVVEPRRDPGRLPQARGARARPAAGVHARHRQRLRAALPQVHRRPRATSGSAVRRCRRPSCPAWPR